MSIACHVHLPGDFLQIFSLYDLGVFDSLPERAGQFKLLDR